MTQSVRLKIVENMNEAIRTAEKAKSDPEYPVALDAEMRRKGYIGGEIPRGAVVERLHETKIHFEAIADVAGCAQVVVFPVEQAKVFLDALREIDFDLEYILPFRSVLIQFSAPLLVNKAKDKITREVGALLLDQITFDKKGGGVHRSNYAYLIHKDLFTFKMFGWESEWSDMEAWSDESYIWGEDSGMSEKDIKNLAIACIGYINCENVYLHPVESVPESVNAKRERKGKSRLEPYYVCRIRGVQYDANGHATGEGAKHGIRYDVRGHFRRLTTGKITWVTPHQRGIKNELYIPKTYLVDKQVSSN